MLARLQIQGLAIIDSLEIEFSPGFNVITGETGAGKSILIRALSLLSGGKSSSEMVRQGATEATVLGEFLIPAAHPAMDQLLELGIGAEEGEGELFRVILRRRVAAKGRSQCWVNDVSVTTASLRNVGVQLLDIFGQHENQRLMDSTHHVHYLDNFLSETKLLEDYSSRFEECQASVLRLKEMLKRLETGQEHSDFLAFRLEELTKFNPTAEDFAQVEQFCERAKGSERLKKSLQTALDHLEGERRSVGESLWGVASALESVASDDTLKEIQSESNELASKAEDLHFRLRQVADSLDFSEADLESSQERLYGYQDLMRKHRVSEIADLLEAQKKLQSDLALQESAADELAAVLKTLGSQIAELKKRGRKLSTSREKAASELKRSIESELQELSMKGSRFEADRVPVERDIENIDLSPWGLGENWKRCTQELAQWNETGGERIQFLLSANPGEDPLPLTKVASGGELSRIMLAMKRSLAADADTCVLVFDEIDTGISGRVADTVGLKMRDLSGEFQVLCISHLAQVAVYADAHFQVAKKAQGKRTQSSILRLSSAESAEEIARLLSGDAISAPSLENAKALIARAKKRKSSRSATL